MNQSTSLDDDQHPDHEDSVDQSAADDVSFGFNHLQIDNNHDSPSQQLSPETDGQDEDDEGDFTFVCVGDNDSPTTEVSENGQIRFPLFDQSLLIGGGYDDGERRLPRDIQVDKVFIESEYGDTGGVSSGTFRALSKDSGAGTAEMNMKSNSTGFSKLWRFRDNINRSNSDGRDAFVFLESPDRSITEAKPNAVGSTAKVNAAGGVKGKGVKKVSTAKKGTASAHEVYLKQRGEQTEEDRRRSYLPYRPGLMGFFTNVNGGLSKNVHPF